MRTELGKKHRFTRVGRLVGACAVVGALLAGSFAGAGSASALSSYAGQGTGYALRVVVDMSGLPQVAKDALQVNYTAFRTALPVAAQSLLPTTFPLVIDQRLIETLADMGNASHANSILGHGFKNFTQGADASKSGQSASVTTASQLLPSTDLPLINVAVGKLDAAISSATSLPKVSSSGSVASVSASLTSLLSSGILPPQVVQALTAVTTNVNTVVGTANSALDTALNQVASAYGAVGATTDPILGPVLGQTALQPIVTNATSLTSLINIPTMSDPLRAVTASVNGLVNTATTEKSASMSVGDAASKIGSIDLLGLLNVGVVDMKSHSAAGGTPGSAKNTSSCSLSNVRVGGLSGVSLDGKSLIVNGLPVPVPAADISAIKTALNGVLSAAGLTVGLCDVANGTAAKDGTSASQTLSALSIQFAPTSVGPVSVDQAGGQLGITKAGVPLLKVIIDPSVQTSAAAKIAAVGAAPALPRTGPAPTMTIVIGIVIAASALLFLFRRRLGSLLGSRSS